MRLYEDMIAGRISEQNFNTMLEKYCEKQGWEVVAVYQDDGFTGLNMERPDLQRMLRACLLYTSCGLAIWGHLALQAVPIRQVS